MFAQLTKRITEWRNERQTARILAHLDPRLLADIGQEGRLDPHGLRSPGLYGASPKTELR